MKYPQIKSGEWVQPNHKKYKMACCDCGLVHDFEFKIVKGKIFIRGKRNKRATSAVRRFMKKNQ